MLVSIAFFGFKTDISFITSSKQKCDGCFLIRKQSITKNLRLKKYFKSFSNILFASLMYAQDLLIMKDCDLIKPCLTGTDLIEILFFHLLNYNFFKSFIDSIAR